MSEMEMADQASRLRDRAIGALHGVSGRKRLAISPYRSVNKGFLFPDGHGFLEGVDEPAAGFVGMAAMRRGHDDEYAGFADLQAAETVNDRDVAHAEAGESFARKLVHLPGGHLFVGFVVEIERLAAAAVVAHD